MHTLALSLIKRWQPLLVAGLFAVSGLCTIAPVLQAQPIRIDVRTNRPIQGVGNLLPALAAVGTEHAPIALYYPRRTEERIIDRWFEGFDIDTLVVHNAVRDWEYLLLGLGMRYRVIYPEQLSKGVHDDVRVLIMPASEDLTRREERRVRDFVKRGGGLIASGRFGLYDAKSEDVDIRFFREMFLADYIFDVPAQPTGILQSLDNGHPLTAGLPPGMRLNLGGQIPMGAALSMNSVSAGRLYSYDPLDVRIDPFATLTMTLYGENEEGRFVWTHYNPQEVSQAPEQQDVYQAMMVNALCYVARIPMVALRPWPNGLVSATVISSLPLVGRSSDFEVTHRNALDALEAVQAPATFFMTANEAVGYPDILQRMELIGEVAVESTTDNVLRNTLEEQQAGRLAVARDTLAPFVSMAPLGIHPPGGYWDVNTLRAMQQTGYRYMLLPPPYDRLAPNFMDIFEQSDFREVTGLAELIRDYREDAFDDDRFFSREELGATGSNLTTGQGQADSVFNPIAQRTVRRSDVLGDPSERVPTNLGRDRPSMDDIVNQTPTTRAGVATGPISSNRDVIRDRDPSLGYWVGRDRYRLGPRTVINPPRVAQEDRIISIPKNGRDDYVIIDVLNLEGRPEAQVAAYAEDFSVAHQARGLYTLSFHPETQALTAENAGVIGSVANYVRQQGSWLTTYRSVRDWWLLKTQINFNVLRIDEQSLAIEVINGTGEPVNGISFDVHLGRYMAGLGFDLRGNQGTVEMLPDGKTLKVVLDYIREGETRLDIGFRELRERDRQQNRDLRARRGR